MTEISVKIRELRKIYDGKLEALKGINLDIPKGSFFGLLGPNGAGKTTAIGIMTGLVNITSGSVEVMGHDVIKDYKKSIQILNNLIQSSPKHLLALHYLGHSHFYLKNITRSEKIFNYILTIDPKNKSSLENLQTIKRYKLEIENR